MYRRKRTYRITLLNTITIFLLLLSLRSVTVHSIEEAPFEEKRILFISSYSSAFPTYFQQIEGLQDAFEDYPIVLDIEFMDSKRFFNEVNLLNFKDSISYKLSQVEYDLVMTSDDNAINFVMENRDELFNGLPVIFFGVNNETNAYNYSQEPDVTGVIEDISMKETIDLAMYLNPSAEKVVALVDNTTSGQSDLLRFHSIKDDYPAYEFTSIDMSELSMDDFLLDLSLVDSKSILVLFSALRDADEVTYPFNDSVELLLANTDQPIYHLFEHGIEEGLLGGRVVSHYSQGNTAGNMALIYLIENSMDNIPLIDESPNVLLINFKVFEEHGFHENRLPSDVQFLNRDYSFLEEYGRFLLPTVGFFIFQTIVIGLLVINIRKRNKTKQYLLDANNQLLYNSYHDYLTGLYNRNYFEVQYPHLKKIEGMAISLILIDVNGLKLLNDAFGHKNGDKALTITAKLLLKLFIDSDIFRIGGDEFAIIPYGRTEQEVSELVQELETRIAKESVEGVPLSVSVGHATLTKNKTLNELFTEAEDWMYREKLNQVPSNRSAMIDTIIATINQKDEYSEAHSKRVSVLSAKIAQLAGLNDNKVSEIRTAGLLHDIGKIIVPSDILNKTGHLTPSEFEEMKKHCEIGYRILNSVSSMRDISEYVLYHHERIDGKGYPLGLKGDDIPIQAKVIALADAIDAMLTTRLYREKTTKEKCYKEIKDNMGTQFCSDIANVVLENFDEIVDIISHVD